MSRRDNKNRDRHDGAQNPCTAVEARTTYLGGHAHLRHAFRTPEQTEDKRRPMRTWAAQIDGQWASCRASTRREARAKLGLKKKHKLKALK